MTKAPLDLLGVAQREDAIVAPGDFGATLHVWARWRSLSSANERLKCLC